ncbi:flagellar assembly protein FliW [Paenibacillus dauci]|uniref:flagellar assembly protein FliW n=1 Tax=Paenibacillus dauci TaxID=1567106 RepID=UPI0012E02423
MKVNIETIAWGKIEITEEQLYKFEKGIPGFEEEKSFAWIQEEDSPFSYLQSIRESALSFLLVDPFLFYPEYAFEMPDQDVEELGDKEQLGVACIVTLHEQIEQSTINLLAPIVMNKATHQARQIVLQDHKYQTKHPLQFTQENQSTTDKGGQ